MKQEIQQFETIMTEFVPDPNHEFGIDYGIVKDAFIFPDEIAKDFQYPGDREAMKGTECFRNYGALSCLPPYNQECGFKLGLHFAPRHLRESISEDGIVITPEPIDDGPHLFSRDYIYERRNSAYFYLSPQLDWMCYFGDVMSHSFDYDLWVIDISEALQVPDEAIKHGIHYHVGDKCFTTPVAIRTREWHKCKPLGFMEVPDHITKLYAMNGRPIEPCTPNEATTQGSRRAQNMKQEIKEMEQGLDNSASKKPFKVMGTGSRSMLTEPDAREIYSNLEAEVLRLADKYDLHLISGMAEGWDEAIAKAAMRNNIPYTVMIPNKGYGNYYWGKNSLLKKNRMNVFNELVKQATKVVYVCNSIYVHVIPKSMLNGNNTLSFDKDLEWFHPQEAQQQVLQKNRGYFADGIRFIHVEKYADTYQLNSDGTFSLVYTADWVNHPSKIHANFIRNQAMVDECDGALVYKPESRGTKDAVERLEKADKPYKVAPFK